MAKNNITPPSFEALMVPTLEALNVLGGKGTNDEIYQKVCDLLSLDDAILAIPHGDTGRSEVEYRLAWSRTYLARYGLIENPERGFWRLVEPVDPTAVDVKEIVRVVRKPEPTLEDDDIVWPWHYPLDSVFVRKDQQAVVDVVRRINAGRYVMDPDFQRDFVWGIEKQSKLVESALMRIPLPVFYLAEQDDGKLVVVDGLQRLTTFQKYLGDEFGLRLPGANELDRKKFSQLETRYQNRLEDAQLILYIIDPKVPDRVKLDIFERVNGGVPLNRQQMRNCVHVGPATIWLKQEAREQDFQDATGGSLDPKGMRDRELINRFCAFSVIGLSEYRGNMDDFLEATLKRMNKMPPELLVDLSVRFRSSMRCNFKVFGHHAFRKRIEGSTRRSPLNVALFDVFSVLMARYDEVGIAKHAEGIQVAFDTLAGMPDFQASITLGTNQANRVETRFAMVDEMLVRVIGHV